MIQNQLRGAEGGGFDQMKLLHHCCPLGKSSLLPSPHDNSGPLSAAARIPGNNNQHGGAAAAHHPHHTFFALLFGSQTITLEVPLRQGARRHRQESKMVSHLQKP